MLDIPPTSVSGWSLECASSNIKLSKRLRTIRRLTCEWRNGFDGRTSVGVLSGSAAREELMRDFHAKCVKIDRLGGAAALFSSIFRRKWCWHRLCLYITEVSELRA